ncbi:MAG: type I restriction-modification enzyme R subunit C-terminal domain-containing protein [Planctomycetota bacterium]
MKGRGTRVVTPTELQNVSGEDARAKTHFVIVEPVGVCESDKTESRPLDRNPTVPFKTLMQRIQFPGGRDEDTLTTLASRLTRLDRTLEPEQRSQIAAAAGDRSPAVLARALLDAFDPDVIAAQAAGKPDAAPEEVAPEKFAAVQQDLIAAACSPFDKPALRDTLEKVKRETEQAIDIYTPDEVLAQGFDEAARAKAAGLVQAFRDYCEQHKAEIAALQILYSRPYKQRLTEQMLKELEAKLKEPFGAQPVANLWQAFELTADSTEDTKNEEIPSVKSAPSAVKKNPTCRFADLVALVRFALQQQPVLEPFAESVAARFNAWLIDKARAGVTFAPEQLTWLNLIRDHIATSLSIEPDDFESVPFNQHGGLGKAYQLFGEQFLELLDELNEVLAA